MLLTAESSSAWSLIYPSFTVVVPQPDVIKAPLGYPVRRGDGAFVEYLSTWIELKRRDGTLDRIFEHWILGRAARQEEQRWSVIRNVLGWVE